MDHVAHGVYIGGARLLNRQDDVRSAGIMHILKLYEDVGNWAWESDFIVCNNTVTDGEFIPAERLRRGVDFVAQAVDAGSPILVVCGAGISRSSTFVLAYLLRRGYTLPDAWRLLKRAHTSASPHPMLWESLIIAYDLPYATKDIYNNLDEWWS